MGLLLTVAAAFVFGVVVAGADLPAAPGRGCLDVHRNLT